MGGRHFLSSEYPPPGYVLHVANSSSDQNILVVIFQTHKNPFGSIILYTNLDIHVPRGNKIKMIKLS